MTLTQLQKSDLSKITYRTTRERNRELGRIKNARFLKQSQNKFYFSSPQTYDKKSKYNIVIEKNGVDIKLHCSCEAFSKQGFQHRCTKVGAAVLKENREDKRWGKYHGGALLCKHLYLLFNNQKLLLKKLNIV